MRLLILILMAVTAISSLKQYTKCEFATELMQKYKVPERDIAKLVCRAEKRSSFDAGYKGYIRDTLSHGIFGIRHNRCFPHMGREVSHPSEVGRSGYYNPAEGCGVPAVPCDEYRDLDFTNDIECMKKFETDFETSDKDCPSSQLCIDCHGFSFCEENVCPMGGCPFNSECTSIDDAPDCICSSGYQGQPFSKEGCKEIREPVPGEEPKPNDDDKKPQPDPAPVPKPEEPKPKPQPDPAPVPKPEEPKPKPQPVSEIPSMIKGINKHYEYTRLDKKQIDAAVCVAKPRGGEYEEVDMSDEEVKSQLKTFIEAIGIEVATSTDSIPRRKRDVASAKAFMSTRSKKTKRQARNISKPRKIQGYFDKCDDLQYLDGCDRDEIRVNKVCTTILSPCIVDGGDTHGRVLVNKTTKEGFCAPRNCHPSRVRVGDYCYDPRDSRINYEGRVTYETMFGEAVSTCPDGYFEYPGGETCQPILTKIDNCPGEVFWFDNFHHEPKCLPDPCKGMNLNRNGSTLPFVPSEKDGKCYQIATQHPICHSSEFYAVNMDKLKGVCTRLDDAGYTVFSKSEMEELEDQFGKPVPKAKKDSTILTPASTKHIQNLVITSPVIPVHHVQRHPKSLFIQPTHTVHNSPWVHYGHHRQIRSPHQQLHASYGNVMDPRLIPCQPGCARGVCGKCREINLPSNHPYARQDRPVPANPAINLSFIAFGAGR